MSTAANPVRGEATLVVGGETLVLRPSFEALVAAEQELGPLFALVERAADGRLTLAETAALFWHCVRDRPDWCTRDADSQDIAHPDPAGAMSATFAAAAARLSGAAGALAGWTPGQFWEATPAELAAVLAAMVPGDAGSASPGDLERLMEMFPDG